MGSLDASAICFAARACCSLNEATRKRTLGRAAWTCLAAASMSVKFRVVDQHHSVGPGRLEVLSRLSGEPDERADAEKDLDEPHHGEVGEPEQESGAGRLHPLAAEAADPDSRRPGLQRADEVGAVQVAARLAGANEDVHEASLP